MQANAEEENSPNNPSSDECIKGIVVVQKLCGYLVKRVCVKVRVKMIYNNEKSLDHDNVNS
jgi:hypothetical protein